MTKGKEEKPRTHQSRVPGLGVPTKSGPRRLILYIEDFSGSETQDVRVYLNATESDSTFKENRGLISQLWEQFFSLLEADVLNTLLRGGHWDSAVKTLEALTNLICGSHIITRFTLYVISYPQSTTLERGGRYFQLL